MGSTSVFRLDPRHGLRLLGIRLVLAAALVVLAGVLLGFGGVAGGIGYVLGGCAALLVVLAIVALIRPPGVVRLDEHGYRIRQVPRPGTRSADWAEVTRVEVREGHLGQTLVVTLEDGRRTSVPLVLVARQAKALKLEMHDRLNRARGYGTVPTATPGTETLATPGTETDGPAAAEWSRSDST